MILIVKIHLVFQLAMIVPIEKTSCGW